MPLKQRDGEGVQAGECRQCRTFCDRLVDPRGCLELRCRYLYSYVDSLSGAHYMGCMRKVFGAEIDLAMFEAAERNGGYGGIKMTGGPLPHSRYPMIPAGTPTDRRGPRTESNSMPVIPARTILQRSLAATQQGETDAQRMVEPGRPAPVGSPPAVRSLNLRPKEGT